MTDDFLEAIASTRPTPGGGGASAFAASVGAALLEKIIRLELGREGLPPSHDASWRDMLREIVHSRESFSRLKDADGESYVRWAEAKARGVGAAVLSRLLSEAVETPLAIGAEAIRTIETIPETARLCRRHLLPDAMTAAELLAAATRGALCIAAANLATMKDAASRNAFHERIEQLRDRNERALIEVRTAISERS